MLIRFRVQNFRSLKEEQELSLVASSLGDMREIVRKPEGIEEGLLPTVAIYGANASGKSNVLKALAAMEDAVRESQKGWSPEGPIETEPFLLDKASRDLPTTFQADILVGGKRFEYGFSFDRTSVVREWLNAYPNGRKQMWFARDASQARAFQFGKQLSGENRAIENLTRRNSLFLSAAAQNNHELLLPIYSWFADRLYFLTSERSPLLGRTIRFCKDNESTQRNVQAMMAEADLGIVGMDIGEEAMDDKMRDVIQAVAKVIGTAPSTDPAFLTTPRLVLRHRSDDDSDVPFDSAIESEGTLAWFGLLGPVLRALERGRTLCVDELDSSLHPVLAKELVRLFNDPSRNTKGAQLIFNTHDTNLLDLALFRRDQIWFIEKDRAGASHLYPLTDFKPRKNDNLERGYLQGRYGAVPFVGPFDISTLEQQ